jgi:enamine deaminase RidA (YjgF/YER057c/UK114 family)
MEISRLGIISGADRLPIISKVVVRGDTVYLCSDARNPPVRACVGVELWRPELLVEVMAIASR